MKLYIIELLLNSRRKRRFPVFANSEMEAKALVIRYFENKYRQVINGPVIKLVRLVCSYKIQRGVLKKDNE